VVDIERLTRWLDTSRRILVVATTILPGYRDSRYHPMHAQRLRPIALIFAPFDGIRDGLEG